MTTGIAQGCHAGIIAWPAPQIMPYTPVVYDHVIDACLRDEVFRRAYWLLGDAYGITGIAAGRWRRQLVDRTRSPMRVDGISCHVCPTNAAADKRLVT